MTIAGKIAGNYAGKKLDFGVSRNRYGSTLPSYDALFSTRSGLSLIDSVGGEQISVKQFPVANYVNANDWYCGYATGLAPITTSGDYTALIIARNENSDTKAAAVILTEINGNDKGGTLSLKSGPLYNSASILQSKPNLDANASGKVVTNAEPWVLAYTYDVATTTAKAWLNGTEIDSVSDSNWALGLASGQLSWKASTGGSDARVFAVFVFDRKLTAQELLDITDSGIWPTDTPSRMYIHSNYGDTESDRVLSSITRNAAQVGNNGSNYAPPTRSTMWTSRYNNPVFSYLLDYGYTGWGNFKIPYIPNKSKAISAELGDIEFPTTSVIHNMAESLIDFSGVSDATIKAIFDKSNRTYWKTSIESEDHYTDAGGGYYGLWHPSQLIRSFVTTHAQSGHENHIFAGLRTSGQVITGITKIAVYKTNVA